MMRSSIAPEELRAQLARFVGRICPEWLAEAREDLVQVAFMKILQMQENREHNPPPSTSYVWKVAYTTTVDEIRRRRPVDQVNVEEARMAHNQARAGADPFHDQALRELSAALRRCLEKLLAPRRLAVIYHLLGHSLAESERLTGWDGKRVRNLLYRGLGELRQCLQRKGYRP